MRGALARWYARGAPKRIEQYRSWAEKVARLDPGRDILEVAPGPGLFSIELARRGSFRITGLDISPTFVEIARGNAANAGVSIDFREGNASRMPFADETFDFTFCSAAFKNFTDPVGALREMHRVLRPGGSAMILDLRKDASLAEIDREVNGTNVGAINAVAIRMIFRFMLLKRADTKRQLEEMVLGTQFRSAKIDEDGISIQLLLTK
jgi:ubiquinone/menaquinone biosynthesis C-methylase UbiE